MEPSDDTTVARKALETGLREALSFLGHNAREGHSSTLALLELPFELYSTFRLEQRFGFNKTTPALYVADLSPVVTGVSPNPVPALNAQQWITINGTGGSGSDTNIGVWMRSNAHVTSVLGNIAVTGALPGALRVSATLWDEKHPKASVKGTVGSERLSISPAAR